jgi:hypothetical protein
VSRQRDRRTRIVELERCDFCRGCSIIFSKEVLNFRQRSDRGIFRCSVVVPIGRCDHCGFVHVTAEGDATIKQAAQVAYEALPSLANVLRFRR